MELDLKNDKVGRLLTKLAVPAIIAMVVNGLYYLVDAAFVGWGVGANALAGLAVIFPAQMFMIAWGSMLGMGVAAIVSRKLGENDPNRARSAVSSAIGLSVLSGVVFTGSAWLWQNQFLNALGATAGTLPAAREYIWTLQFGFVFVFLSMVGFNVARAQGKAKEAARGMILGTVVNVVLDPLFIFQFNMGVAGAALATVIARVLSTVYFLWLLNRPGVSVRFTVTGFHLASAGQVMLLGVGNFLGQISFSVIAIIINHALGQYGSDVDLAVYGILGRIHVFVTMPLLGLAQGFQPVAGYSHGCGDQMRVREALGKSIAASVLIGAALLIVPLAFPRVVLGLFCDDLRVVNAGVFPLRVTLMMLPFIGIQTIGFSFYQAVGDAGRTLLVSLSRQLIFLVPLLVLLSRMAGLVGLWAAFPVADGLAVLLTVVLLGTRMHRLKSRILCGIRSFEWRKRS